MLLFSIFRLNVFRSGTDLISLLVLLLLLFLFFLLLGDFFKKLYMLRIGSKEWQECSVRKYTSVDQTGFSIWRDTFRVTAMTSNFMHKSVAIWWVNTKRLPRICVAAYASSWFIIVTHMAHSYLVLLFIYMAHISCRNLKGSSSAADCLRPEGTNQNECWPCWWQLSCLM